VEGIRVAPNTPSPARARISSSGVGANAARAERAEPVREGTCRDEETGEDQRVDIDDPEQLHARRGEFTGDLREREGEHGVIDGDDDDRQQDHRERDPASRRWTADAG